MLDWLTSQLDWIDLSLLSLILVVTLTFFWRNYKPQQQQGQLTVSRLPIYTPDSQVFTFVQSSFINRMKLEGRKVLILYGSQTGTSEELAGRIAKDVQRYRQKALLLDPEEIDVAEMARLTELEGALLVLFMATYGEGDPTDNARELLDFFTDNDINLRGINFAVFGLGNKTYEHYNEMGKFFDRRLEALGAKRVYELGLGDDDGNLEEDFMRWREGFWPIVTNLYAWELSENGCEREYRFEPVQDLTVKLYTGEINRLGAFEKQRPPFDQKNPYIAIIGCNRELHGKESERSCRHIEFLTNGARIRYEAGDHLGVFPSNDVVLVNEIARLLNANLELAFNMTNLDEESYKKSPFPCPCTVKTALTHYVDICAPVKSNLLRALVEYTSDDEQRQRLLMLSTANEQGLKEYGAYIQKQRRSIIDILRTFTGCKPPIDYLLELLPRLQARYYSISSSPKHCSDLISVTAVVTKYYIGDRLIKGICTNYLLEKKREGKDTVPIFVRKSTMRLPHRLTTALIMIGPGTGLAPYRGFIQDRAWHKEQGKEIGEMYLYFGCRHPEQDFIYKNELNDYLKSGVLTEVHLSFSRLTSEKVYVQDKLWMNRNKIWELIDRGAYIYVCGDARNMARDVQNTFTKIFMDVGGKTEEDARKFLKNLEKQRRYQADVWS